MLGSLSSTIILLFISGTILAQQPSKSCQCSKKTDAQQCCTIRGDAPKQASLKSGANGKKPFPVLNKRYVVNLGQGMSFNGMTRTLGATYLFKKGMGFSASFMTNQSETRKLPTHINNLGGQASNTFSPNKLKAFNVAFVKMYNTASRFVNLGFESGIDVYSFDHNSFTYNNIISESTANTVGKYFIRRAVHRSVGISLKMKIDLPLTKFAGLELSPGIHFNKDCPVVGMQMKVNVGKF